MKFYLQISNLSFGICAATVKNIIRQNKKGALLEFLFGSDNGRGDSSQSSSPALDAKIQNLQNQVNSLQQQIIELEKNQSLNLKDALVKPNTQEFKSFSEDQISPLKTLSKSHKYNIPSNQDKGLNGSNFITSEDNFVDDVWRSPGKISEDEQIEIIQKGFKLQAQEIISLKKYYESTGPDSLFQWKGYSIKYESIRRRPLFKQLKP